jgi:DNA invertase Pin-like site-specific DNA recombinase
MNPRVAIYLRVSTEHQNHESQRIELEEYCQRRGWSNVRWFTDTASGAKQNRDNLNQLMELVRRGRVDTVVTFKLDRLARSLSHLAHLIAELQTHKVALICPGQGIDTSNGSPCAQFQLNILAAVAQFERELITERVNAGLKAARQRGVKLGRPAKRQRHAEQVKALLEQGLKTAEISRRLGIPYSSTGDMVREIRTAASN